MTLVAAVAAGFVATAVALRVAGHLLRHPSLERENYRGRRLPTGAGLLLVLAVVAVDGGRTFLWACGLGGTATSGARVGVVGAVVAFGLLGLIDDLLGDGSRRGLRGHLGALVEGRVTTGFLKLAGGAAVALTLAAALGGSSRPQVLVDGAVIALAANLGNLLDRAPGRAVKAGLVASVALVVAAGTSPGGHALAVVAGSAAALLSGDVRERFMLGDTGANALGAALGTVAVISLGPGARQAVVVVLLALTLLSEVVPFSRIIAAVPPLRGFDRLGRAGVVLLAAVVATGVTMSSVGVPAAGAEPRVEPARRLLVFSVPGLSWAESSTVPLPAIDEFLDSAALADLVPRSVAHNARAGDAYLTISAGTRATTDVAVDGQQLGHDERFAGSTAADIFSRRTGDNPAADFVALGWPRLERVNRAEPYDAVLGLLASSLEDADVRAEVIANGDGSEISPSSVDRAAGLALARTDGTIAGDLSSALLVEDPARAYGVRMDVEQAVDSFDQSWGSPDGDDRAVVLVEASDLARTIRYRDLVDAERFASLRAEALGDADRLFARLLERVDPERDAVLVIAPYQQRGRANLLLAGLRRPGGGAGYLRSASTQRAGIVTLVDVAPTILATMGVDRPVDMEGRPFEVVDSGASLDARRERLDEMNAASRFRERLLFPTTLVLVLALAALAAATVTAVADGPNPRRDRVIAFAALANLAGLPASYLARAFPLEDLGSAFYWAFLVSCALAIAAVATVVAARAGHPRLALALVLGTVLAVPVGDVLAGSHLHLSSAFGYSPTGNSRLYGISNYSFGQITAAGLLLAAIAAAWLERRGRVVALGLLVTILVVLGVPVWGSDVGGVLAFTPTILLFAATLYGWRLRPRTVALAALATVAAVTAFGFLDLARPPAQRAHLGRLFERIGNEGLQPLVSIVDRKLTANLRVSTSSFWVAAIPVAVGFLSYLRWWSTKPLEQLHRTLPTLRAALLAIVTAAVLGSLLNDSGAIVGGVALLVLTAALAFMVVAAGPPPEPAAAR